jgi:hypothetical protein
MSRLQVIGITILACGAISGFATGGALGLVVASVCLITGLVMVVASEARGMKQERGDSAATGRRRTQVLVAVKEVHARPQQRGKFRAIESPDQTDLELEVFLRCWLVNETDVPLHIEAPQLDLKSTDGTNRTAERVSGDFANWQLGALQEHGKDWDAHLRVAMEGVKELDTAAPLECGLAREGWLHYRFRNVTPSEFQSGPMQVSIKDSLEQTHVAVVSVARHLPGRIWPVVAASVAAGSTPVELATSQNSGMSASDHGRRHELSSRRPIQDLP